MKLERLHEYILPVVATLAGMGLAVYCGKLSGNGQLGTLAFIVALSIATVSLLALRQNVWILLPLGWLLYGQVPVLPLPFAVRDLTVMTVFVCVLALKAFKIIRIKPKLEFVDLVLFLLITYMVTVFLRNPVGVNALGSERVGGRPYFDLVISVLAYWVLVRVRADEKLVPLLPFLMLAVQTFEMFLNLLAFHVPKTAPLLTMIYTGVDLSRFEAESIWRAQAHETAGRQTYLASFGNTLGLVLCSYWRPLTMITPLYWWRFFLFMLACVLVALSGFRSGLIAIFAYMVIASLIRRGISDLVPLLAIAVPIVAILVAMQGTVVNLPRPVQRTLSFLPGRWDPVAVNDARISTQWRMEMWKIMLTEDKYIDNKLLGDGFGLSKAQLAVISAQNRINMGDQENYLIIGNVHSGPISTIRYAGYVGLAIFMVFLILSARIAWRHAQRAKDSPYFALTMFITIPLIYQPFNYVFVFGSFDGALPVAIYSLGMLKMIGNTLDSWEESKNRKAKGSLVERSAPKARALSHSPVPV